MEWTTAEKAKFAKFPEPKPAVKVAEQVKIKKAEPGTFYHGLEA